MDQVDSSQPKEEDDQVQGQSARMNHEGLEEPGDYHDRVQTIARRDQPKTPAQEAKMQ